MELPNRGRGPVLASKLKTLLPQAVKDRFFANDMLDKLQAIEEEAAAAG